MSTPYEHINSNPFVESASDITVGIWYDLVHHSIRWLVFVSDKVGYEISYSEYYFMEFGGLSHTVRRGRFQFGKEELREADQAQLNLIRNTRMSKDFNL